MDDIGETREDIKLPEGDVGKEIMAKFENPDLSYSVTVLCACGQEMAIAVKNMPK